MPYLKRNDKPNIRVKPIFIQKKVAAKILRGRKKRMAIKCVALDMDRTTLNRQGRLSKTNRIALEQLIAKGIHVIIASGRSFGSLPKDIFEVPGIDYAITGNGASMYHVPSGKCLKKYRLSEQAVEAVMRATGEVPVTYEAFIDGAAYAGRAYVENPQRYGATPEAVEYVRATRQIVDDIVRFIWEHKAEMDSMDIIVKDEDEWRSVNGMVRTATDEVYITSSIIHLVEIADKNAGKKSGVAFFMELLDLKREEVAAFGDADNDADMLRFAGCGIAMENASRTCKEAADFVTKHHDEDGVAYGLRHILKLI